MARARRSGIRSWWTSRARSPALTPILASLVPLPTLHQVDGGDHSFKVSGRDAKSRPAAVYSEIQDTIAKWIQDAG